MPRPRRVKEPVAETDRQKRPHRRQIARTQRAQRPGHRVLRLALALQRPDLYRAVRPAQVERRQTRQNRDNDGKDHEAGHVTSTRSAKWAPTGGKLSSAATAPPISSSAASRMA